MESLGTIWNKGAGAQQGAPDLAYDRVYGGEAMGTSKQGSVTASYHTLLGLFGKPDPSADPSVRAYWDIRFDDGTVASIYDWEQTAPLEDVTRWNVGGFAPRALWNVLHVLARQA